MLTETKQKVRDFWNAQPCGTRDNPHPAGTLEFYRWVEAERDDREPFIAQYARWSEWRGKRVLEMGIGAGTDFSRFLKAGANAYGVDLTPNGVATTRTRLRLQNLPDNRAMVGDVERLPFRDASFDYVYSWGVIHHTENTPAAAREVVRVLKPGGEFCVMIYNRWSLVSLQAWLMYGVLKGKPFRSIDDIAANHLESFGTKLYGRASAAKLFPGVTVEISSTVTPYDLRIGRFRYLPAWVGSFVPSRLGYFMIIKGRKPA